MAMRMLLIGLAMMAGSGAALAQPPEQAALGRRMAAAGDFNAIVGAMGAAEVEQLARDTPGLTEAERDRLRAVGRATLEAGRARLLDRVGAIYARQFTAAELAAIVGFLESPAGRVYTGAFPRLLPEIAAAMGGFDLGGEIRAAFCRETGKLCPAPAR
jgi:hypothetical protein